MALGTLETHFVSIEGELADLSTKPLYSKRLQFLICHLGICQLSHLWLRGNVKQHSSPQLMVEGDDESPPESLKLKRHKLDNDTTNNISKKLKNSHQRLRMLCTQPDGC